jgi:hypothetical protein
MKLLPQPKLNSDSGNEANNYQICLIATPLRRATRGLRLKIRVYSC